MSRDKGGAHVEFTRIIASPHESKIKCVLPHTFPHIYFRGLIWVVTEMTHMLNLQE